MKKIICKNCKKNTDTVLANFRAGDNKMPDPAIRKNSTPFRCVRCGKAIKDGESSIVVK